jgi:membrane protein required for colicin V production
MTWLDWLLLAVLLVSVVVGMWRGLVYEVLSLAAWVAAFLAARAWGATVGPYLPLGTLSEPLRLAVGFGLVFIGAAFAGGLVAWLISKLVGSVGLRPIDRALGAVFGLLRGGLALLAVSVVVSLTPMHTAAAWRESVVAQMLDGSVRLIGPMLPSELARYLP